jgi:hypothetical protein
MINYFKFKSYVAFNFVNAKSERGIKIEVYKHNLKIDFFDYVSTSKKQALTRLREFLNKGVSCDNIDYINGINHIAFKVINLSKYSNGEDNINCIIASGKQ